MADDEIRVDVYFKDRLVAFAATPTVLADPEQWALMREPIQYAFERAGVMVESQNANA